MVDIHLIHATVAHLNDLQKISTQTFYETFAEYNTPENMRLYIENAFNLVRLTSELTNPHSTFFLVNVAGKTVGYFKINTGHAQTEFQEENGLELERIYIAKEYIGKKIGTQLFTQVLSMAIEKNKTYLWLGVWEHNTRALNFYTKLGLAAFGQHTFTLGTDPQTDILMRLDFKYE